MPKKIGTNEFNIISLTTMTLAQNAVDTRSRRWPHCALNRLLKDSGGRRHDFKIEDPANHRCRIADGGSVWLTSKPDAGRIGASTKLCGSFPVRLPRKATMSAVS